MGKRQTIHIGRLRESLEMIPELRGGTVYDDTFSTWKDRTQRSLKAVFGEENHYVEDFEHLHFSVPVMGRRKWDSHDKEAYAKGLTRAETLLSDAIEEVGVAPEAFPETGTDEGGHPSEASPTVKLVVQQNQSVQQIQTLSFDQIIGSIDELGIPEGEAEEARELAEDFRAEAEGEGRWSRLGEILEGLKGLGQTVWKRVAVPLLLEWIKHETGMSGRG